jgi:hypothetical protein
MSRQRELPPILPAGHTSTGGDSNLPGSDPLVRRGSFPGSSPIAVVKAVGAPWGRRVPPDSRSNRSGLGPFPAR